MNKPMKIVIIDDNEDDRLIYQRALHKISKTDYTLYEADNGENGLSSIEAHEPDCVLLDYSLPGRNGIDILKEIRNLHPFMPVVMLTGQGNEMLAVTAMQAGAQNYISKSSITSETLEHVIHMAVEWCMLQKRLHDQRTSLEVFTRALAHDLKEPLRTIRSFAELIEQNESFSEKTNRYFQHIQNAAARMQMLIDTVFFYTRLDAPDQAEREICDAGEIVKETQDNLAQLISEHQAVIQYDALPRICVNRIQFMQVLQNLIGNAIRHNEQPITVTVSAQEQPEHWLFSIKDNGAGIEADYLSKIFEPFKRLANHEVQGAGLGLAICRRIIESHGGKIWCSSQPGDGANFYFTVPKPTAQIMETTSSAPASHPPAPEEKTQSLASLLLVDDSWADVEIAKFHLVDQSGLQCNMFIARGGMEAISFLEGNKDKPPVDLMLLDINMPEMDGFELLEYMHKQDTLKDIPVVMCSGSLYDKDMARARALGAVDYLVKPIEFSKLQAAIAKTPNFQLRREKDQYLLLRAA